MQVLNLILSIGHKKSEVLCNSLFLWFVKPFISCQTFWMNLNLLV